MKRFLSMIVAACAFFAASAQNPMVTLSHNGELSFFTNLSAFEDALDAAQDGDTIYLPEGIFTSNKNKLIVTKRISIVGSGYKSQILCNLNVNMVDNPHVEGQSLNIDGVSMINLSFDTGYGDTGTNSSQRNNIGAVFISNSKIDKINQCGNAGKELSISKCNIGELVPYAVKENQTLVTNSKINKIMPQTYDSSGACMTLINCNVWGSYYMPSNVISSIIQYSIDSNGGIDSKFSASESSMNAINTYFYDEDLLPSSVIKHNCYFGSELLDEDLNYNTSITDMIYREYIGQDGTVIGIMGGESPFSENPSVPTVDSSKSSVEYDATSNKLKVSIAVKAD